MIHEIERSCRIASCCVSASMTELKYKVTLRLVAVEPPRESPDTVLTLRYGEISALGKNTVTPTVTIQCEDHVRSRLSATRSPFTSRPAGLS